MPNDPLQPILQLILRSLQLRHLTESYISQIHAHEPSTIQFQLHIEESPDDDDRQRWCVVERYIFLLSLSLVHGVHG